MNIGEAAREAGVSVDTLRYYERAGLLPAAARASNGYRRYGAAQVRQLRFVRGAQALGFTLAEIRAILPRFEEGRVDRQEIEQHLHTKIAAIDAQMRQLRALKRQLLDTFGELHCEPGQPLGLMQATTTAARRRRSAAKAGR